MSEKTFKHECSKENAQRFAKWLKERDGVAVWKSQDLVDPSASWSSPVLDPEGKPTTKPSWKCSNQPDLVVTEASEIGVFDEALFKAIPVTLKKQGYTLRLNEASQRKVDKILDECKKQHGDAFYKKGVLEDEDASIGVYYPTSLIPLDEWLTKNPETDSLTNQP